jgi:uncharacterized protein (UPF0262 family)
VSDRHRIVNITLDERLVLRRNPDIEHERQVAIFDLLEDNQFRPAGELEGPYDLHLSLEENRLVFAISGADGPDGGEGERVLLPLTPFRKLIKEYFVVCGSYFEAIKRGTRSQIEALDMGRRGLHNDGSELLCERLEGKIELDFETARRLFTLLCVLLIRG